MSIRKCFIAATICSLALGARLFSQITLEGVVTDNGSERVRNAFVKLTDQADPARTFGDSTDASGRYSIRILPGTGVDDQGLRNPGRFQLMQNYPNPFNPSTVISFELNRPSHVRMDIFNALGRKVRTLFNGFQSDCAGRLVWDGTDDRGLGVSAGLYIYSLSVEGRSMRKKMLLLDGSQAGLNRTQSPSLYHHVLPRAASDTYTLTVTGTDIEAFKREGLTVTGNTILNVTVNRTVTDIDGNVYKTVKIGSQWWMAENLKTTRYRNGDAIPNVIDNTVWVNLTSGAYCDYNNYSGIVSTYGRLYNWYAVADRRGLAPVGWHVPLDAEWQTLIDYLGGESVAGGKMKEAGTAHWHSPNTGADNSSGFSALPSGLRYYYGSGFVSMGSNAVFWSSTEYDALTAWFREMYYLDSNAYRKSEYKWVGFSIRLVRD